MLQYEILNRLKSFLVCHAVYATGATNGWKSTKLKGGGIEKRGFGES